MVSNNRITNGFENNAAQGAQANNDISLQAEISKDRDGLDEINSEADIREAFSAIRDEAGTSISAAQIKLLYRRGADLIELLDKSQFQERVGEHIDDFRRVAGEEFAKTARTLNRRCKELGAKSNFAEKWGG